MLRITTNFLITFMLLAGGPPLFAAEDMPEIASYSQLNFAVHRGDSIKLQVEATGENISAKWVKSGETFCRELTCEVNTSDWGLGTHKIVFVVFNGKGSLFLKYKIKILTVPPGYKPGPVTPSLVTERARIESVTKDDFAVVTTQGRGFSSHNRKVQVIGPIARAMDWTEKLKTQPGSRMEVYSKNREVHYLLSSTSVALIGSDTGRRAVQLKKGTLRSRQLAADAPVWSVIAGNWLQIDGDEKADFFAKRPDEKKDEYEIGVYRGRVRVTVKNTGSQEKGAVRHELILVPGETVRVSKREKNAPQKQLGNHVIFAEIFRESTPHYIPPNLFSDRLSENHLILGEKITEAEKNSLVVAQESIAQLDFIVALEALNKRLAKAEKNTEVLLLGAEAYLGMLQLREAKILLGDAKIAAESDPRSHFLEAVISIMEKNWPGCLEALNEAEDREFENEQLLEFYRGRCEAGLDNVVGARNAFTYATWDDRDPLITKTSRDILASLNDERWIHLVGKIGAGFDNNVFRLSRDSGLMKDVGARESWFSKVYGGARFWPFRVKDGFVALGLEVERKDYTNKSLKEFAGLKQGFDVEMQINAGGGEIPAFIFNALVLAQFESVGKKRNMDTLASRLLIGSPLWWDFKIYHRNVVNSDPFPLWNDRVDSKRKEIVQASDRSSKDRVYGFGFVPVDSDYRLGIGLEDLTSHYKSAASSVENYKELTLRIDNSFRLTPRNRLGLDLGYLSRRFIADDAGRKDNIISFDTGWEYLWSTSIKHDLGLLYEKAKSSVSDYTFGRQVYQLQVTVEI